MGFALAMRNTSWINPSAAVEAAPLDAHPLLPGLLDSPYAPLVPYVGDVPLGELLSLLPLFLTAVLPLGCLLVVPLRVYCARSGADDATETLLPTTNGGGFQQLSDDAAEGSDLSTVDRAPSPSAPPKPQSPKQGERDGKPEPPTPSADAASAPTPAGAAPAPNA